MSATTKQIVKAIKVIAPYDVKFTGTGIIVPGDETSIEIPFKTPCEFSLNAQQACDALEAFGVNFIPSIDGENIEMRSGNRKITMKASIWEYEPLDGLTHDATFVGTLNELDLHRIQIASKYTYSSETRKAACCVFIQDGSIVSTDTHRLYYTDASFKSKECILLTQETVKLLDCFAGDWLVSQDRASMHIISTDGVKIVQDVVNERFPSWQAVIPKENPIQISFVQKELREAIKQGGKFSNPVIKQMVLECTTAKTSLKFIDPDYEREYSVDLTFSGKIKGDDITIAFNWKLFDGILANCPYAFVMELSEPNRSAVIDGQFLLFPILLNK